MSDRAFVFWKLQDWCSIYLLGGLPHITLLNFRDFSWNMGPFFTWRTPRNLGKTDPKIHLIDRISSLGTQILKNLIDKYIYYIFQIFIMHIMINYGQWFRHQEKYVIHSKIVPWISITIFIPNMPAWYANMRYLNPFLNFFQC